MSLPVNFSLEDCKFVCKKAKINEEIVSYEICHWSENVMGYLGEHLRLKVKFKENNNVVDFFVKSVPFSNLEHRKNIEDLKVIEKEGQIYELIFNHMPDTILNLKWRPQCFFSRDDIIVLEDISNLGYRLTPDRFQYTNEHVQSILKSLATLHAASQNFEENILKDSIKNHYLSIFFETTTASYIGWFVAGLKTIKGIAAKYFPAKKEFIENQFWTELYKVFDLIEDSVNEFPCVVTHRDMWAKNVMFNDNLECILLDFQISRYLPQSYDIMMCMYLHLRTAERKIVFMDNLNIYYEHYLKVMKYFNLEKKVISFEKLQEGCKYFELLGLVIKAITNQITHLPAGFMDHFIKSPDEYKQFANIDRTEPLLALLEHDDYYREWMVEAVEELLDYTMMNQL